MKHSKKLVSADNHSNIFNFHYTYLVTLVPVCKDDLVLLPKRLAETHGNISRLVVAQRITSAVQFVDPLTAQTADVSEEKVRLLLQRCGSRSGSDVPEALLVCIILVSRGAFAPPCSPFAACFRAADRVPFASSQVRVFAPVTFLTPFAVVS